MGIPYTTQVSRSWPDGIGPVFAHAQKPGRPVCPHAGQKDADGLSLTVWATESNSTSTEGQWPFTFRRGCTGPHNRPPYVPGASAGLPGRPEGPSGAQPVPALGFPDLKFTQTVQPLRVHGCESGGHVLGYDNARHVDGKLF